MYYTQICSFVKLRIFQIFISIDLTDNNTGLALGIATGKTQLRCIFCGTARHPK
jgi:hypothetical protein